jgi:putative peptide zinc metalloprotease protein
MSVSYSIEKVESSSKEPLYVLTVADSKVFYVGELICRIIEKLAEGKSKNQIQNDLNEQFRGLHEFNKAQIDHIVDEKIAKLGIFGKGGDVARSTNSPLSNIKGKWTITTFEMIKPLLSVMQYLFRPTTYLVLFIALLAINSYYMYIVFTQHIQTVNHITNLKGCGKGMDFLLMFYPCAFLILYMHELGHAAASYCFKVIPKNIGMGFYLIFPVLYTELNGVWKLSRTKRTIINTAGIFVQLLLNLILIAIVFNVSGDTSKKVSQYLIQMNIFTMLLNINPFLKFDGYWILSDLFKFPNLRQQSNYYIIKAINFLFPKIKLKVPPQVEAIVRPRNLFLIIYSLLKYCFIGYILYALPRGAILSVAKMYELVSYNLIQQHDYSTCTIEAIVKTGFGLFIIGYFLSKPLQSVVQVIAQKVKKRS